MLSSLLNALLAAVVLGVVSFGFGEGVVHLLAHHQRRLERRYLPGVIAFVVMAVGYALVSYIGR